MTLQWNLKRIIFIAVFIVFLSAKPSCSLESEHPNHAWSYDFIEDRTETSSKLRVLCVLDYIHSDSGPELVAKAMQTWLAGRGAKSLYITPGRPWENPYIESFHDKV